MIWVQFICAVIEIRIMNERRQDGGLRVLIVKCVRFYPVSPSFFARFDVVNTFVAHTAKPSAKEKILRRVEVLF